MNGVSIKSTLISLLSFFFLDGNHDHQGHMKIGLWVLAGILSFLIIEKVFAKEGEFDHVGELWTFL